MTIQKALLGLAAINILHNKIDNRLKNYSPTQIMTITLIGVFILTKLKKYFEPRWNETPRQMVGRWLLRIPQVKQRFDELIEREAASSIAAVTKSWGKFGPPVLEIPEKGWTEQQVCDLLNHYYRTTIAGLSGNHYSGTIYRSSLTGNEPEPTIPSFEVSTSIAETSQPNPFDLLTKKIGNVGLLTYQIARLMNSLHSGEFSVGSFVDYQVVRMVARMYGGAPDDVKGFVTSGGTESIMLAMRCYREYGMRELGHAPGESIILIPESAHAAFIKGAKSSLLEVKMIKTDEVLRANVTHLKELLNEYGDRVVAIVGSAPSYATGVIDPIREMAALAHEYGVGMHVDCCLGGHIINNIYENGVKKYDTNFLGDMPGVTSLSSDTHKNGLADKDSSVLATKRLRNGKYLANYSIYTIPNWVGGVYGTPKDAGSKSCVQSFNAFATLLVTGEEGYIPQADFTYQTCLSLANMIKTEFSGRLRLIVEPEVNVIAFKVDETWGLPKGASYAFAHEMAENKFVLNKLSGDMIHYCITMRSFNDSELLNKFRTAAEKSLQEILRKHQAGEKFPGDAGLYCTLDAAFNPTFSNGYMKFIEMFLYGPLGAEKGVEQFFLAQQ